MDLEKLDILMADDVTYTVSRIVTDMPDKSSTSPDAISSHPKLSDGVVLLGATGKYKEKNLHPLEEFGENSSDSKDPTVKLRDIHRHKRPAKRKKKKPERKNVTKFQCEQCPKIFNHTSSLVYHRLSAHEKTKNFICTVCGRGFAHKQLLNNHKYVHADGKYFNCDVCPAKFKSKSVHYQ